MKLKLIFCTKIGDVMNLYPRNKTSTLKQLNLRLSKVLVIGVCFSQVLCKYILVTAFQFQ